MNHVDCTTQTKTLRVTVTGDFNKNAVRRMKYALRKLGGVEKRHFFPKAEGLPAAAQFDVTTVYDAAELKSVLERISGVEAITVGANDA